MKRPPVSVWILSVLLEIRWVGYVLLQTIYGFLGLVILVAATWPAAMRYLGWNRSLTT